MTSYIHNLAFVFSFNYSFIANKHTDLGKVMYASPFILIPRNNINLQSHTA